MVGRDKTKKDTYTLKVLLKMFSRNQVKKNHPLQRKPDQWTEEAKSGLAATVIKGEDVDSIKLCEQIISSTEFILWLIDGLQRLTVLEEFRNNAFKMGKALEMPFAYYQKENKEGEMETVEYDLRGKYFSDLPEELQDEFDSYSIEVVKHLDCTDEEVAYHIGRYNRQTSMNTNQKNVLPMYKVAGFIKTISDENEFFKNFGTYTEKEFTKGVIDRVVSESIMTIFYLDKWTKGKTMSKFLNDNATEEEFNIFNSELNRLCKIVDKKTTGQLFNSKNSFIWFAAFHRFTKLGVADEKFANFLKEFQNTLHSKPFDEYENDSFDTYDNNRSTKDKKVVLAKLDMLDKLMNDYLHIDSVETKPEAIEKTNNTEESILSFVQENANSDATDDDVEFYTDMVEDCVKIDTPVYKSCKMALIALMAYACQKEQDQDFESWIKNYKTSNFSPSQKTNYLYLKRDFDKFIQKGEYI